MENRNDEDNWEAAINGVNIIIDDSTVNATSDMSTAILADENMVIKNDAEVTAKCEMGDGVAISAAGTLTVDNSTVKATNDEGNAINFGGDISIINSNVTATNNSNQSPAIYTTSKVIIDGSKVSANSTNYAINAGESITIRNSSDVTAISSSDSGAGLFAFDGDLVVDSSTVTAEG